MIVQDENSNGSRSMHSRTSQLDIVPSSQLNKQQYYKQQWKRKGASDANNAESHAKSRPAYRTPSANKIKVIVLLDSVTLNESSIGNAIQAEFKQHEESPTDEKFQIRGVSNSTEKHGDTVPSGNHLVRWTRSNLSSLDNTALMLSNISEFEPFVLLIAETEDFLLQMLLSEDGYAFEQLGVYIANLYGQLQKNEGKISKILALIDLEKAALKVQRKISKEGSTQDVLSMVDSAVSFLLYEFDIEVFRCKKESEMAEYVYTLTRLVSNRVADTVVTEIDCVAKAQKEKVPEGMEGSAKEQFELQQTWSAMLQMIPLMSKDKAQTLIDQPNFSCPQHLLRYIHHNPDPEIAALSVEQKKLLLQNAFGVRKSSKNGVVVSKQVKLSKHVYNLVTSMEPEELISKVYFFAKDYFDKSGKNFPFGVSIFVSWQK